MDLSRFAWCGESLDSALARVERLRDCVREVWPCFSCLLEAQEESGGRRRPVNFVEEGSQCGECHDAGVWDEVLEQEHDEREQARYAAMSLFDGPWPYGFTLALAGRHLYTYGDGAYGWGPVSSATGAVSELVRWATADEAEAWGSDRGVFSAGAVVECV